MELTQGYRRNVHEKCGIFAVHGDARASVKILEGINLLQHRGQDSVGVGLWLSSFLNLAPQSISRLGEVNHWFKQPWQKVFAGDRGIGHNRYITQGKTSLEQTQPVMSSRLMLAHNGNLPETRELKDFVQADGRSLTGKNDSMLMHDAIDIWLRKGASLPDAVREAYPLFKGAFSVVAMTEDVTVGFKDRFAVRPLAFGIDPDGAYVFSSETRAFTPGTRQRELLAGEMVVIDKSGESSHLLSTYGKPKPDCFESIYFMKPDSIWQGETVAEYRRKFGVELARKVKAQGVWADLVLGVPNSALISAEAFANELGIEFGAQGITRNPLVTSRGYISHPDVREELIRKKYNMDPDIIRGKSVYVGDDSFVRGDTFRWGVIPKLWAAGAKMIHAVSFSPPIISSHEHGADMPVAELIHFGRDTNAVRRDLGLNSMTYMDIDGLYRTLGLSSDEVSTFCFTGEFLPETQHLSPIRPTRSRSESKVLVST